MIREAKGVALHDLSFWSSTLPLLDGLPRIMRYYRIQLGPEIPMTIDAEEGRRLHDETLDLLAASDPAGDPTTDSAQMANSLRSLLRRFRDIDGDVGINVEIPGCGVVVSGSCDLLALPYVIELKLTNKEPGLRDVRQVLMYAALLYLSRGETISNLVVANPRLGVAVVFDLRQLLLMTGGLSLDQFSAQLSDFLVTSAQSN